MDSVLIGNINFEWELGTNGALSLEASLWSHRNFVQLSYLPLLYAKEDEGVCVTHLPPEPFIRDNLFLMSEETIPGKEVRSWAYSPSIEAWAKKRGLLYQHPPFPLVRELASKVFSFTHAPVLPGASLLHSMQEVSDWAAKGPYPKVLKSPFGYSGREKAILDGPALPMEVSKLFENGGVLIGEPWVPRLCDFSTQWEIGEEIHFVGATLMENSESGVYSKTRVGENVFGQFQSYVDEHIEKVKVTLKTMQDKGFYGPVGIDSMVYKHKGETLLHPIVEINPRRTMGWVALKLMKEGVRELTLSSEYSRGPGLLPDNLILADGKKFPFRKQLYVDMI